MKPNFLVIGAGRSGTTSLHHYLASHPDVFVAPVKSPSYFYAVDAPNKGPDRQLETRSFFVHNQADYERLFDSSASFTARGEVSPAYLAAERVPEKISRELDDVLFIAVIRNPVDRLFARFVARRRDGLEKSSTLSEAISHEIDSGIDLSDTAGTYVAAGFVSHVLHRYIDLFGRDRLNLHLYDDFAIDPQGTLSRIFEFLSVDSQITIDTDIKHNASGGAISSPLIGPLWRKSARLRTRLRPFVPSMIRDPIFALATRKTTPLRISAEERQMLGNVYGEEIRALSSILGRDLDHWTDPC